MGAAQDAGNHWRSADQMSALPSRVSHPPCFALRALSSQRLPANADDFREAIRKGRALTVTLTPDTSLMQDM